MIRIDENYTKLKASSLFSDIAKLPLILPTTRHGLRLAVDDAADKRGRLRLVGSPNGADGSVRIHQDVRLFAGLFDGDEAATLALAPGRRAYVHVARGAITVWPASPLVS